MRQIINFNNDWLFRSKNSTIDNLDLSTFEAINVPHTWNNLDGEDGGGDYLKTTSTYLKKFILTKNDLENELFIEFRGVNSIATVFVNKQRAFYHEGGFSTFRVHLNDFVVAGENELIVLASNEENDHVYPQFADFTFYGGIYRDVFLIKVPHTHFDLEYYGSKGVVLTPTVKDTVGMLNVRAYIKNHDIKHKLDIKVYDGNNLVSNLTTAALDVTEVNLEINDVILWQGRKNPHLYKVVTTIYQDDLLLDEIVENIGFRYFKVDPEKGFSLNSVYTKLRGVSRHQDRLHMGWAITKKEHEEDMALIKEVGANTIRLAHYQHDQYFYDLCDKEGMVIWAEIPYISAHMDNGKKNVFDQMLELIVQNYNHPSIMFWGLSNEITMRGETERLIKDHEELNAYVKVLDPTRLTTIACVSMTKMESKINQITDVLSYNHYFGWYAGKVEQNGPWLDKFHELYPNRALGLSEYGCEAIIDYHEEEGRQGDYSEEYQAYYHEEMAKTLMSRDYIWSSHVWNMFDFAADSRNEGGRKGRNHKGLVTYDRSIKKDSFYLYKAYWNKEDKFVHICSKRYKERASKEIIVKIYSNLDNVKLYQNDVELELFSKEEHVFKFKAILVDNENHFKAIADNYVDETTFIKVEQENENYHFSSGSDSVTNWFEDGISHEFNYYDGYLSINTSIKEVMSNPLGYELMQLMLQFAAKKLGMGSIEKEMLDMLGSMTIARVANLAGDKVTPKVLYSVNEILNKLKPNIKYEAVDNFLDVIINNQSYKLNMPVGYLNLNSKFKVLSKNKVCIAFIEAINNNTNFDLNKIKGIKRFVLNQLKLTKILEIASTKANMKLDKDIIITINNVLNKIKL